MKTTKKTYDEFIKYMWKLYPEDGQGGHQVPIDLKTSVKNVTEWVLFGEPN